jgi:thymidylate kinase
VTVAFMGLDGSGKSTQAELLVRRVSARGERCMLIHHSSTKVPGIAELKRRCHGRAIRVLKRQQVHVVSHDHEEARPSGGTALSWIISAYILSGSFLKAVWYRWRSGGVNVIFDRCFLDDVVKAHWRFGCRLPAADVMLRLVPRPDLLIVLDGSPAVTYERKKSRNCTYDEYLRKKVVFDEWLERSVANAWRVRTIDINGKQIADVHEAIVAVLDGHDEPGAPVNANARPSRVSE